MSMLVQLARAAGVPGSQSVSDPEYSASWTTTFREPLLVPAGSTLGLQGAALASNLDTALTIRIEQDITMSCRFLVWIPLINNDIVSTFYPASSTTHSDGGQTNAPAWMSVAPIPTPITTGGDYLVKDTTFSIPKGLYTPEGLCQKVTQATSVIVNDYGRSGDLLSPFSVAVNADFDKQQYWLENAPGSNLKGAQLDWHNNPSIFNLAIFGSPSGLVMRWDDGVGRVELAYAHNPMQNATGAEVTHRLPTFNPATGQVLGQQYTFFGDKSGIVLTDVGFGNSGQPDWNSPTNIFSILGFTFEDLLIPGDWHAIRDGGIGPAECPSFTQTLISANLMPDSSEQPGSRSGLIDPSGNPPNFIASLGQRGRQASNGPRSYGTESPMILVECDVLQEPTMVCSDGRRRRIIGYATKEFESGGFLFTSLSANAVFTRTTTLSSVGVRLLDSSKDFSVSTGIGLASELILEFQLAGEPEDASPGAAAKKKRQQRRRRHKTQRP
jgi:hypothetical protein